MTEQEFHSARQMFFVKDGTVLVAPKGYPYTHFEWIASTFGTEAAHDWIENRVRGYVHNERLVAYTGTDFSHRLNQKDVLAAVNFFEKTEEIKEVGFGAVKGTTQPWEPRVLYDVERYKKLSIREGK